MGFLNWTAALAVALGLTACSFVPTSVDTDADVIVVGDSILAWHRGTGLSIPSVVEQQSGLDVSNVSISGATFLGSRGIPTQYADSDWDWMIVDGGGNDLLPTCGMPDAGRVLDALISQDGQSGAMPAFISRVAGQGVNVILLGYYPVSERGGAFAGCVTELDELSARQARFAETISSVTFVDAGKVVGSGDEAAYAEDWVHPSPRGAALVGQLITSAIRANGS
ncbi:SGNH/GDSL hydrolase family protein [Octadecabacter sp. 1_MG-2023]|uniref:SGNH/GDSL hydrolase family protein n=1 Tax=unclassified Octadecabacter TaxID=196158 RepID=UPI001C08D192|nr:MULTISPECIES: SGNH/GDSL hydrolase family protein [unclassified Octadecabacter]MBU2992527.1 SGNH/GDSL hydrolase family protein [Octadecabacter sp. B2R22]MDO6734716.1 SGNH/GDSL hydrolase family protein [Octadecabacter sp. 1_MG-2023]